MLYFWLGMAIISTIFITVMGFREGFDRWYFYYIFSFIALLMYVVRRWMLKRMVKHMAFLEEQNNQRNNA